jgi:hypothetical protein
MFKGRPRDSGLGSADSMTLAQARVARDEERLLIRKEIDPVAKRRDDRQQSRIDSVKAITFKECADAYIKAHEASWRNAIHRQQWRNTLDTYVHPIIGALPVHDLDMTLATRVLEPIWQRVPESASRIRGRLRVRYRLGQSQRVSRRREPVSLAWSPQQAVSVQGQNSQSPASRCSTLR